MLTTFVILKFLGRFTATAPRIPSQGRPGFQPVRGTQREYSSKPLKHSIVKRILAFKR